MVNIPGVDYAWSHPGGAALARAGKQFAARYLSHDASKDLVRTEAADLAAHDVWAVVVWESTAQRPLAGRAAGIADAQVAVVQAAAAGMPKGRPIYFAMDFDASAAQLAGPVAAYFEGAASVVGVAALGGYGGYATVRYLLDHGLIRWAWQTRAWSAGRWDSRTHIRQGATQTINGVSCDLNTATQADYGQWMPGRVPEEDDPMAGMTSKDIYDAAWRTDAVPAPPDRPDLKTNPTWTAESVLTDIQRKVRDLAAHDTAPQLSDAQVGQIATALAANGAFVDKLAEAVADKLAARLQS